MTMFSSFQLPGDVVVHGHEILAEVVVEVFDAGANLISMLEWVSLGVGDTD